MTIDAVLLVVLAALAAAGVIAARRVARRARARLDAEGLVAEGEVLEIWQDGTGSYGVRYRYTPEGGTPVTRAEYAGCLRTTLPQVGERVRVRYDPQHPRRARLLLDDTCAI